MGTSLKYTRDMQTFEALECAQRSIADNHRPKPTKVIEVSMAPTPELQTS
jgi:hypothetical protein